jgi:hypothetical protein
MNEIALLCHYAISTDDFDSSRSGADNASMMQA